jgi:hypothetical protein
MRIENLSLEFRPYKLFRKIWKNAKVWKWLVAAPLFLRAVVAGSAS